MKGVIATVVLAAVLLGAVSVCAERTNAADRSACDVSGNAVRATRAQTGPGSDPGALGPHGEDWSVPVASHRETD